MFWLRGSSHLLKKRLANFELDDLGASLFIDPHFRTPFIEADVRCYTLPLTSRGPGN